MPEYLAPGVFVEETSYRAKTLEGVSTTTTGFVGPTRSGPVCLEPDLITNLSEFEQVYGDGQPLVFGSTTMPNFMWHAARAFFSEGGKRLYVSRVFLPKESVGYAPVDASTELAPVVDGTLYQDGHARYLDKDKKLVVRHRHPGTSGNLRVKATIKAGRNVLGLGPDDKAVLGALNNNDLVWIFDKSGKTGSGDLYIARWSETEAAWKFFPSSMKTEDAKLLKDLKPSLTPKEGDAVRVVTLSISLRSLDGSTEIAAWHGLPLHPEHSSNGSVDSLFAKFANAPSNPAEARRIPLVIARDATSVASAFTLLPLILDGKTLLTEIVPSADETKLEITSDDKLQAGYSVDLILKGGHDGLRPTATEYEGKSDPTKLYSTGLKQFEEIEDISIVAAPGTTWDYKDTAQKNANATTALLIAHAEKMRYRIAVLDCAQGQTISDVRNMRAKIDSKHAALYYPWIKIMDPITRLEADFPPSGFVAGIYARNDVERGVWKAPANEVVRLATGFESNISKAQQEVLNPEGINCFRFFEGRGNRLWGARTISSDPEWKYVNVRRYFAYLERTIEKGTQWAVFEPNGDQLWANVRRTIEDFLLNEWQSGALLGTKPEQAYFVRCDRSTMSQNDPHPTLGAGSRQLRTTGPAK